MPQRTALRRVSTLVVGALFAVVFVCSGASATHGVVTNGESAIGAHTTSSKAAARTVEHTAVVHRAPAPGPLAATAPSAAADAPEFAADVFIDDASSHRSITLFTTSERAPPAL